MFTASILSQNTAEISTKSFSEWLDRFDGLAQVTAAELEQFRAEVNHKRYTETVLRLAHDGKLRPKVLADAAYTAWLKAENPKQAMCGSQWAELFRLAHQPNHELFEVPNLN